MKKLIIGVMLVVVVGVLLVVYVDVVFGIIGVGNLIELDSWENLMSVLMYINYGKFLVGWIWNNCYFMVDGNVYGVDG